MAEININALANLFFDPLRGGGFGLGGLRRWQTARYDIYNSQILYESDGYGSQAIQNIVDFAVGDGLVVNCGNDYVDAALSEWRWNLTAPLADRVEMESLAMLSLLRDGDIISRWREGDGEAFDFVEPRFIWSTSQADRYQAGVKVDAQGRPEAYIYNPTSAMGSGAVAPVGYEEIPAEEITHVFRLEYAGQARGLSWIRKAVWPLYMLRHFDDVIDRAAELAVTAGGFWTIAEHILDDLTELAEDTDPAEGDEVTERNAKAELIQMMLQQTDWNDPTKQHRFLEGVTWNTRPVAGISDYQMIEGVRMQILDRVGASIGVSRQALTDPQARNIPVSRIDLMKDFRFYRRCQRYLMAFEVEILDRWAERRAERDPRFRQAYEGFEIRSGPFPYLDILRDAQALKILTQLGLVSPQSIIRDRGQDPGVVKAEVEEWATWQSDLEDQTGVSPSMYGQVDDTSPEDLRESDDGRDRS